MRFENETVPQKTGDSGGASALRGLQGNEKPRNYLPPRTEAPERTASVVPAQPGPRDSLDTAGAFPTPLGSFEMCTLSICSNFVFDF